MTAVTASREPDANTVRDETVRSVGSERPAPGPASAASRARSAVARLRPVLGAAGLLLIAWQAAAWSGLEAAHILPGPIAITGGLVDSAPAIAANLPLTAGSALVGYAIAAALAVAAACLAAMWAPALTQVVRAAIVLESLPTLALTPIVVIVAPGHTAGSVLAGLSVFFIVLMGTVSGLGAASPLMLEVHRAAGGRAAGAVWSVRLPAALPSIFSSLMIAVPAAVVGTIMSEYLVVGQGLGGIMLAAYEAMDSARVWAIALTSAALTGALFWAIGRIRDLVVPWAASRSTEYRAAAPTSSSPAHRMAVSALTGVVTVVVVLGLWVLAVRGLGLNAFFAKTPSDVWGYLVTSPDARENLAEILAYLAPTLAKALAGLAIGTAAAVLAAWLIVSLPLLERAAMPLVVAFRAVPLLVLTPAIGLLVGSGAATAVALAAILSFFTTLISLVQAARSTPRDVVLLARSANAGAFATQRLVTAPFALPALFGALRITAPGALMAAMSAEWLMTGDGIGFLMIQGGMESRFTTMWSAFVVMAAVSLLVFFAVALAERVVLRRLS
ncbi:ABC transporter permease [Microbacterium sp. NPDC055683]